jgi:hypothetical protein
MDADCHVWSPWTLPERSGSLLHLPLALQAPYCIQVLLAELIVGAGSPSGDAQA